MRNANILFFLLLVNSVFSEDCKETYSKSPMARIKRYLFCNYDADESPANKNGNSTLITFGMIPRLANFDEKTDNFDINALVYASWLDQRLAWVPTSFENTTSLYVPSWRIWGPDIVVHSPGGGHIKHNDGIHCHVYYFNGTVTCIPSITFTTRCKTDFTLWPYDRQNCTLVLGAWGYTGEEMNFKDTSFPPVHMDYFVTNSEWRVIVSRASYDQNQAHYFPNMTTPVVSIDFILDRVHNRMSAIYVTPGIILIMMTLTTLWLDPRSIERISIACFNPLVHLLCIQNLHWALPHNGVTIPHILLFYVNSFALAFVALILTFALREIHNIERTPPKWISGSTGALLRSRIGQIMLIGVLDPKASAIIDNEADDSGDLVNSMRKDPAWTYVSILIGWITFVVILVAYVFMYSILMPDSSMRAPLAVYEMSYQ